jgi:hemerythrin-like metal-binding protein
LDILPRLGRGGVRATFPGPYPGETTDGAKKDACCSGAPERGNGERRGTAMGDHMPFMEWKKDYSVGVAIFDDEHKKLIAIINQLHEAFVTGVDKGALQAISDNLVEYTLMHFRHEEMYFDDWAYPEAAEHVTAHTKLRQQVFEYRKLIMEKNVEDLAQQMAQFLRDWLLQHIMVDDRKYGTFLYDKGLR